MNLSRFLFRKNNKRFQRDRTMARDFIFRPLTWTWFLWLEALSIEWDKKLFSLDKTDEVVEATLFQTRFVCLSDLKCSTREHLDKEKFYQPHKARVSQDCWSSDSLLARKVLSRWKHLRFARFLIEFVRVQGKIFGEVKWSLKCMKFSRISSYAFPHLRLSSV